MNITAEYLGQLVLSQLSRQCPPPIPEGLDLNHIIQLANANHMDYMLLGGLLKAPNLPEQYQQPLSCYVFAPLFQTAGLID